MRMLRERDVNGKRLKSHRFAVTAVTSQKHVSGFRPFSCQKAGLLGTSHCQKDIPYRYSLRSQEPFTRSYFKILGRVPCLLQRKNCLLNPSPEFWHVLRSCCTLKLWHSHGLNTHWFTHWNSCLGATYLIEAYYTPHCFAKWEVWWAPNPQQLFGNGLGLARRRSTWSSQISSWRDRTLDMADLKKWT